MNGSAPVRFGFDADPAAPGLARRVANDTLAIWDLVELAPIVELLVSEVVTNTVRHARSRGEMEMSISDRTVRVAVSDHAGGELGPQHPRPDEPTGRGLAIVDSVATRWGVGEPDDVGKTVWFELDVDDVGIEV